MPSFRRIASPIAATLTLLAALCSVATAQTLGPTSFTYQGQLQENGQRADGSFDFEFSLYDSAQNGTLLGIEQHLGVAVVEGLFTVHLDFGNTAFDGQPVWLETQVAAAASGSFTTLSPRQAIVATPQAIHSLRAAVADDADRVGGLTANTFLRRTGDAANGDLGINGGDLRVDTGHGLESQEGAKLITGNMGETFQFYPGSQSAHLAIFNDAFNNPVAVVDAGGKVGIGANQFFPSEALSVTGNIATTGNLIVSGICFRPRQLVRCYLANVTNHLTWVDNVAECNNAGGTVDGGPLWFLAQC